MPDLLVRRDGETARRECTREQGEVRPQVTTMDAKEYTQLVDDCLAHVADWLEPFDPDQLDYQTSDGVITFVFADKTRFVLNRQSAVHQVWFAAGARAWHYNWDGSRRAWVDDRDGHELFQNVVKTVSAKLGRALPPIEA